jgi:hypothetical protein
MAKRALVTTEVETAAVPALFTPEATEGGRDSFFEAVSRLEIVVDAETSLLRGNAPIKLDEFNHRKSRGLLELNRVMKTISPETLGAEGRTRLETLRGKLEGNIGVLQMHLTAVREVSTLISRAIQDAESDGTYTSRPALVGRR